MIQETSTQSYYEEKRKGLSERHNEILKALEKNPQGLTDYELAVFLGKRDPNYVRPRRFELSSVEYGLKVEPCPEKRTCRITGKKAIAWRIRTEPLKQLDLPLAS